MINLDELKEKIKIAHAAVKNESEPFKLEAFKIILEKIIQDDLIEKSPIPPEDSPIPQETENIDSKMVELAKNCEISVTELEDVITIKNNQVEIIVLINGNEPEKQVTATQCILISYEMIFGRDWVKATDIKEALRKNGIQDKSGHLAGNLKKHSDIFRMRGSGGGAEYKLTTIGRKSAFNVIKKFAKGE